jgi:hypothetical protein
MSLPADPFGRARVPRTTTRAGRVALLQELADALLEGRLPSAEARCWFGATVQGWLEGPGGELDDALGIRAPRGSHHTPQALARRSSAMSDSGAGTAEDAATPTAFEQRHA